MARRDPTKLLHFAWPLYFYNFLHKWFPLISLSIFPVTLFINAPFGRFSPTPSAPSPITLFNSPLLQLPGISSWIFMELISPLTFTYAFLLSPLTFYSPPLPSSPQTVFIAMFMAHYANRALVNPLRTPSRSKSHVSVILSGVLFNIANGYLMGSYFSSPLARIYIGGPDVYARPTFWIGSALWLTGFIGNVAHDEILLNIRRRANERREKDRAADTDSDAKQNGHQGEHYGIPQGLLYTYISFPNYFCEWVEWFGFALASSPLPIEPSLLTSPSSIISTLLPFFSLTQWSTWLKTPPHAFAPMLSPPWIFLLNELVLMFPRAYRGHLWYKQKFGERYPKERKAIIPFVL